LAERFPALLVERTVDGVRSAQLELGPEDLMEGEVGIRVLYSSVNFKDALACQADGNVARRYPLVPGIDLAGTVTDSASPDFQPGDLVLATGYDLGVAHHGGYAGMARVPAAWLLHLPQGLDPRSAMALGTAGLTAAAAIRGLEREGLRPQDGPVLVTGASGGVGSLAVDMLAARGYEVEASTGKAAMGALLRGLGARAVLDRAELAAGAQRPLDRQRWSGAVDPVGGATLGAVLSRLRYGGAAASIGLTGGAAVETSVLPFILRGVKLFGVESAYLPMAERRELWDRLGGDLRPPHLDALTREAAWGELPEALDEIRGGGVVGRVVVRLPD